MNTKIIIALLFGIVGALALDPICELPMKPGPGDFTCKANIYRYFYNTATSKCELFFYGGCDGNENNFETEEDCQAKCH